MLSAPTSAVAAGAQSVVLALALLLFGYLLASAASGPRRGDVVWRAGLAFPALCGYVLLLSLVHIVTAGEVFSRPWVVRIVTAAVAVASVAALRRRRGPSSAGAARGTVLMVGLLAVGFAVWGVPVFRELPLFDPLPLDFGGDTKLHLGWTMQLLNGERVPSSALTGEIPNYYPWFFHALLAFVSDLTPGGRAFHGLGPLQFVQVGGGVLSFFALGRELTKRYLGAAAAAAFGALSGGIGYLVARGAELEVDRENPMSYLGDLALVRSYNSSFHNLAPTLPRDVTYVLVPAFLLLVIAGVRERSRVLLLAGGVTAGIVGLTGAETFFLCALGTAALGLVVPAGTRRSTVATVGIPMLAVWSLWTIPITMNYLRLGGFVNTTTRGPVTLPPLGILGAWGLLTLVAIGGVAWAGPRFWRDTNARLLVTLSGCATVLIVLAGLSGREGAFAVLGRGHRYWPLLHLTLVPLGAIGTVRFARWMARRRGRVAPPLLVAAIVLLVVPSPILGSVALSEHWDTPPSAVRAAVRDARGPALRIIDRSPGGESCVVAAPDELVHPIFWFSGFRLVHYRWTPDAESNFARVRWASMDEHIPWDHERMEDRDRLVAGSSTTAAWNETADKYGVDHVVTSVEAAEEGTFGNVERIAAGEHVVLSRSDCGR